MATITQYSAYTRQFFMRDSADNITGKTGLTITLTLSKAGGAFAAAAGTITEVSSGWYKVALTNVDTNTAGDLAYHATAAGANASDFTDQVITQQQLDAQHIGSTANYTPTRNSLITAAYRKADLISSGETLSGIQLSEGIDALNLIVREMDGSGTTIWAYGSAPSTLTLQENIGIYTSAEGLPTNILEIISATVRSDTGLDTPLQIETTKSFDEIPDKFTTGTPSKIYMNLSRNPASNSIYVWPLPSDVGTQSEVLGTDALNYRCIRSHTAASTNTPITGANWRLYWELGGSSGGAWAADTAYTAPKLIRLWYKKPLADFTAANDNPDLPPAWSRHLLLRLTEDISIGNRSPEFVRGIERQADKAEARIFRKTRKEQTTNTHNKTQFF